MSNENKLQQAIFPDCPRDADLVDPKTGKINPNWALFFQQLAQALQTNYNQEGVVMPQQTAANITNLGNKQQAVGNIIYDSTNNAFKGILLTSAPGVTPVTTITKTFTLT